MHVTAILKSKGRHVETVNRNTTLAEVVTRLATVGIGAVVVSDRADEVAGIVSERDIVSALASHGPEILKRPVTEVMTRNVLTCRENDTIDELMAVMTEHRFRHLPVIHNDRLAGIISIGDVVKHRVAEIESEATAMRDYIASA